MIIISNIHKVLLQTKGKQILKDFTLLYCADFTKYNTYEYCAELIVFGFVEKNSLKSQWQMCFLRRPNKGINLYLHRHFLSYNVYWYKELRILSRSLCQSLTLNVMISVSHFVRNNQLCHHVTESLNRSQYLCLCFCVCLCQKGHICIGQLCSALKTLMSILTNWLTDWVTMSPIELNEVCTGAGDLSWRFVAAKKEVASL